MKTLYIRTVPKKCSKGAESGLTSSQAKRKTHMGKIRSSLQAMPFFKNNQLCAKSISTETSNISPEIEEQENALDIIMESETDLLGNLCHYQRFAKKYELCEKLGEGSNGVVYRCKKRSTGKEFAAKSFMVEDENIAELKKNFLIIKRLRHPQIIEYEALYLDLTKRKGWLVM
jgi:hypothetical protein